MKRKIQIILSASAASVLAFSAVAQETSKSTANRLDSVGERIPRTQRMGRLNDAAKASDVIGMTVKNYQDEKLGKVEDLGVDVESGRIVQVVVATGGFIGIGDSLRAVPPGAFHRDVTNNVLRLDVDKARIAGAPKFEMSDWAEYSDSNHLAGVYSIYGQEPALSFIQSEEVVSDGERGINGAPNMVSTAKVKRTLDKDNICSESQTFIPLSRLSQVQKASKLLGTPVKNLQDESLGKVENILLDLPSGRVVAVIVSSGGFLGIGDELSAIPPTALRFTTNRDGLQIDASKELVSNAPHFKNDRWPDLGQPSYADGVYRAYRVQPYFSTNEITQPDNTALNVRDRNSRTLTPLDQGNSQADVDTTARIRKEIIAGTGMSVNARNVKIITIDGRVTLRGPVNSAEEKRLIGEIADRIARSSNVDNQLEVVLTTSSNN